MAAQAETLVLHYNQVLQYKLIETIFYSYNFRSANV